MHTSFDILDNKNSTAIHDSEYVANCLDVAYTTQYVLSYYICLYYNYIKTFKVFLSPNFDVLEL